MVNHDIYTDIVKTQGSVELANHDVENILAT